MVDEDPVAVFIITEFTHLTQIDYIFPHLLDVIVHGYSAQDWYETADRNLISSAINLK